MSNDLISVFKDSEGFVPSWDEVTSIKTPDDIPAWTGTAK